MDPEPVLYLCRAGCGANAYCEPGFDKITGEERPVCLCNPGYVGKEQFLHGLWVGNSSYTGCGQGTVPTGYCEQGTVFRGVVGREQFVHRLRIRNSSHMGLETVPTRDCM